MSGDVEKVKLETNTAAETKPFLEDTQADVPPKSADSKKLEVFCT